MDKVDGVSIRDHDSLTQKKIELKVIAENLIQHFLRQAVEMGFSTEICIGNLFVDNSGNIIPVDFGIMGRLDKHNKEIFS